MAIIFIPQMSKCLEKWGTKKSRVSGRGVKSMLITSDVTAGFSSLRLLFVDFFSVVLGASEVVVDNSEIIVVVAGPSLGAIFVVVVISIVVVVFYVLGMTWIAPKFGVGNAVAFVLLGQIISMAIIDHFGLFSAIYHPISAQRLVGLALMAIGVFMSVRG